MGPYKPLRTWVDEFIPYYMEMSWELIDPIAHVKRCSSSSPPNHWAPKHTAEKHVEVTSTAGDLGWVAKVSFFVEIENQQKCRFNNSYIYKQLSFVGWMIDHSFRYGFLWNLCGFSSEESCSLKRPLGLASARLWYNSDYHVFGKMLTWISA